MPDREIAGIGTVAVIGFGTMGRGIVRLLLSRGIEVRVHDALWGVDAPEPDGDLSSAVMLTDLDECVRGADLVIEAVSERLDVKHELLGRVSELTDAIIASNTSTFVPSALADPILDPGRFLIMHFFNPADVVPLVEVVPGPRTSAATVETVMSLLEALGKQAVLLERECPGFVANRLQAALLRECIGLIEAGVVSAEGIDRIVRSGLGPRWKVAGPLGVADLGGLDIVEALCGQIFPSLSDDREPQATLRGLVEGGRLGAKSGQGFYRHTPESTAATVEAIAAEFIDRS